MNFPSPEFGNIYRQNVGSIIRKTLSGETKVCYDNLWPTISQFSVTFKRLNSTLKDALLNYYQGSAGQLLNITDHEGFNWQGFFIDNPEIKCEGRGCLYSVSFTFEGNIV